MFDCANVEMRELLPELASGSLDADTRARVEAHVAECAECAAEVETLRLVRATFAKVPALDTRRIVAALPASPRVAAAATRDSAGMSRTQRSRWTDWRVAAALTLITVGGLSVAVARRSARDQDRTDPSRSVVPESTTMVAVTHPPAVTDTPRVPVTSPTPRQSPLRREKPQLSFGGGVDDLDRAAFDALMGALDEIERGPIVPSAEPGRVTVLPIIGDDTR